MLRSAGAGDWAAISELLLASGLPLDGAREHVTDFILAEDGGAIVGCAAVERYGDAGLLRSVAVSESQRGRGLGVALVERCIADATDARLSTLVLLTTTAERFFPRFGFEVVDRERVSEAVRESAEFRGACPASATVMRLTLSAAAPRPAEAAASIRAASPADAAAMAEIYNAGIRGRMATFETRERSAADIEAWFTGGRHPTLVAERDGRVVGFVAASAYRARECYAGIAEFSVYVAASERGRRVGDTLMAAFIPALERAGFWKVLSRIFPENAASRALCRRHGFREVGVYERHARLDGVWRDVVIVERLIGEAAAR